ncbi:MAG: glycosyltransferase, partial [Thermoleophilia bacterium]|nr:glycosyltransferase [Thermoleophilia bacterium]
MRALLVVPDYVSHWNPLCSVAEALAGRGHDVVVATGPALGPRVEADGFGHTQLRLGAGSNPGVSRSVRDAELDGFFAATHSGMVATLRYQAERRRHDLLWEPEAVSNRVCEVIEGVAPDAVLVDQLAFGATAALRGLRVPFVSFLPGHPCQLPGPGETFGYPALRPPGFTAQEDELASLAELCRHVTLEFTAAYNAAVSALDPEADPLEDAFAAGGTAGTLVNYPAHLGGYAARRPHVGFVGSCVRAAQDDATIAGLDRGSRERPRAYVSLGSFLSARTDVLRSVSDALRMLGWDAVVATGATDPADLGSVPSTWVLAEHIPQIVALESCDLVVCHGGNNTVTE